MNKPSTYNSTKLESGFMEVIKVGGHRNNILDVTETTSRNGLAMLVVRFDTAPDDVQPNYYTKKFEADKKSGYGEAKWKGIMWLIVDERNDYGVANLKRFVTAVEDSNGGFKVPWGDEFCASLKNRKVGIIFREEEYEKSDGTIGCYPKPFRFCDVNKALESPIPKKKTLGRKQYSPSPSNEKKPLFEQASTEEFMSTDGLDDIGLPFN